jgi:hypothetical protein
MRGSEAARRVILTYGGLMLVMGFVSCGGRSGPPVAKVSGTITYKGKAVEKANVVFIPAGSAPRSATGQTDGQGNFKLTTFDTNDGAIVGEHTITISKPSDAEAAKTMDASNPGADYDAAMRAVASGAPATGAGTKKGGWMDSTLPEKYAKKETSPLKRTVAEGDNNFKIDLED